MSAELSIPISRIQEALSLRANVSFWEYLNNRLPTILREMMFPVVRFRDLIISIRNGKDVSRSGYADEETEFVYLTVNNIKREGLSFENVIYLDEERGQELSPKRLEEGDFIITRSGSVGIAQRFSPPDKKTYIPSGYLVIVKIDEKKTEPRFLDLYLKSPLALEYFQIHSSGKSQKNLSQTDIRRFFIPLGSLSEALFEKIAGISDTIQSLEKKIEKPVQVVNRVFAREFKYSMEDYQKKTFQNTYKRPFAAFDKAFLLRSSVKFQHPKYDYLDEFLSHRPWVKLKTLCASPIHRGLQPIYDKDGEIYVIKTANLKNGYIDLTEAQNVNQEFYDAKKDFAGLNNNDVLIASTGVGSIGKVDIYESEELAIADGHVSIVRLDNKKVNPLFMTYYLRSILGYLQIERDLSGSTNQIEIYPQQLEQMRIIDLPRKKQDETVKEVQEELEELQRQKGEIKKLRDQIDKIFMEAITKA